MLETAAVTLLACLLTTSSSAQSPQPPAPIYYFDLTSLHTLNLRNPMDARRAWDTLHLVASLQGIVNRSSPTLFIRFMPHPDDFWFDHLREPNNWLAARPVTRIDSLESLLRTFAPKLKGIVLYDEKVPATSNLASTIAGIEDRLALRYDPAPNSLYTQILPLLPKNTLRLFNPDGSPMFTGTGLIPDTNIPSTASSKCDAYLWLKSRYMDTHRCSPDYVAYYIDAFWLTDPAISGLSNSTLSNHDFFISQRAFFFDLGMWPDESPVDDRAQKPGTDLATLKQLLRALHDRSPNQILNIGGFVPWAWKYTNHGRAGGRREGVPSEWEYSRIISAYNGIMDADALGYSGLANASFYQHFPIKSHYPQKTKPTLTDLKAKGYVTADNKVAFLAFVLFYMGDYDSSAWLNFHVPKLWQDPAHGQIPCAFAFNPNLDRRVPHALHYARTHAAPTDFFIAGDNGAGYLNPGMLTAPRLDPAVPDGWPAWVAHNSAYYKRYDLTITGFIIDGFAPGMATLGFDHYMKFSPDGCLFQHSNPTGLHRNTMPYAKMAWDLDGPSKTAAPKIIELIGSKRPSFTPIRTILKTPTWHKQTMDLAAQSPQGKDLRFVDPYTFFMLVKLHHQQPKEDRK
ncbi:MAG: GxGYxYP family putative glycoside hydrolase [Planctomycetota bacterium]|nr:GxGYxYP family putative glycoside hydrolase [Planctomycetota bacterium]